MSDGIDSDGARAIAVHWGVDVDDLHRASWEIETIDGHDDMVYGYLVRFASDTDPELLDRLGVDPDELTREVSLWAFEGPDEDSDDGIYRLDQPFPDLFAEDDEGDDSPALPPNAGDISRLERRLEQVKIGPNDLLFRPDSPAMNNGGFLTAGGSRLTVKADRGAQKDAVRVNLLLAIEAAEEVLSRHPASASLRSHNNPPSLIEDDPLGPDTLLALRYSLAELKEEATAADPDPAAIAAIAATVGRAAMAIAKWAFRKGDLAVDTGIKWGVPLVAASTSAAYSKDLGEVLQVVVSAAKAFASFFSG